MFGKLRTLFLQIPTVLLSNPMIRKLFKCEVKAEYYILNLLQCNKNPLFSLILSNDLMAYIFFHFNYAKTSGDSRFASREKAFNSIPSVFMAKGVTTVGTKLSLTFDANDLVLN